MKKFIVGLVALLLLGSAGYFYFIQPNNSQTIYLTETAQYADLKKSVIATGTVRAHQRVEVGAQVSGKIEKIYVVLGQQVKAGDVIAEIDSKNQLNSLNTAQAELSSYQAQLKAKKVSYDVANSAYQRLASLYDKKSTSLDELNTRKNTLALAEAEIEQIKAAIKQAEINVDNAKTNVAYTKIIAPINGTIISIPVSEGQTVNANQTTPTIVQIADLSKVLVKPEISEGDITKVKAGMAVEFSTLSDPDTKYQGVINSVDPAMTTLTDNQYAENVSDTQAVYYYANIVMDNTDNKLRIGMTTQNTITIESLKNVLVVPTMTLKKQQNKVFVKVLTANNQTDQREVTIGLNDDVNTQILSGLSAGEKVISSELQNNEKVGNAVRTPRMF
ncbi:efflux RND transporter periplasmic adaptor subunit [Ursidibacter sp. B-7004-1]